MRSFAPNLSQSQTQPCFSLARPKTARPKHFHGEENAEGRNSELSGRALVSLECGFGQPPIHSSASLRIQTKLAVDQLGDEYEKEADSVAARVLVKPAQIGSSGAPPQIKGLSTQPNAAPINVSQVLAGAGTPLERGLHQDMARRFGHDFSHVRVHADAAAEKSARDVNAHAFTVGQNIVFGRGAFTPGTPQGRHLIAHELTHVLQQSANPLAPAGVIQRKPAPKAGTAGVDATKVAELARDPREAHRAWKKLSTEDKLFVLDRMARRYGSAFTDQFREAAQRGKPQFSVTYWQPGSGPTPEKLKAGGWRFLEMEVTGSAAIDVEVWVNPLGDTVRRDVSARGSKEERTEEQEPPDEVTELRKKFEGIKKQLWPAMAEFEKNVERLESDPHGPDRESINTEISKNRNKTRSLITELSRLTNKAEDIDEDLADEISREWSSSMEQYSGILQRYNGIK